MINLLDNTANQSSKFKTKNWVEINDESWGTYNEDDQIRFKISMIRSNLCDYSGTLTVRSTAAQDAANNATNKKVIFRNYVSFTNCISRTYNTQVDDAHDIDAEMLI